ncbi:MAG: SRPBCC domain-containing protein [Pseudolabrys sp.]
MTRNRSRASVSMTRRALVFSAWTDPKHLAQWWGPNGFTTTTSQFEFRVGGVWRFVMHGPDGRDYQNRVTFEQIVPNERIVYITAAARTSSRCSFARSSHSRTKLRARPN